VKYLHFLPDLKQLGRTCQRWWPRNAGILVQMLTLSCGIAYTSNSSNQTV